MLPFLFATVLLCQDALETNLKRLSDPDPAVRDAATAELMKTPVEKLALIEKFLNDPDAEVGVRAWRVMTAVLNAHVGLRKARFELRAIASEDVRQAWVKAGADPKNPPEGCEAVACADKTGKAQEWELVERACVNSEDVEDAGPEPSMDLRRDGVVWQVRFELKEAGARRFDQAAAVLYRCVPRGRLAIVLDERIVCAPVVNAEKFGGRAVIQGDYSEAEARKVAEILKSDAKLSFRVEKEKGSASATEKILEAIHTVKGLQEASVKPDSNGLEFSGIGTAESVDVIRLWQTLRDHGYRLAPRK